MDGGTAQSPFDVNGGMDCDFNLLVKAWLCQRSKRVAHVCTSSLTPEIHTTLPTKEEYRL